MSAEARLVTNAGFSEVALKELSWAKDEPEWLRAFRLESWLTYQRIPVPSRKDEEWRRTDISSLELGSVRPYADASPERSLEAVPAAIRAALGEDSARGGLVIQQNSQSTHRELSPELARKGVILMSLDEAAREHPELVQRYLGKLVRPEDGKFAALHYAFWSGGVFLYVPRNVEVDLSVQALTWANRSDLAVSPHTLVVVEDGASIGLVDEFASQEGEGPAMSNGVVEIQVGAGARASYTSLQRWDSSAYNFGFQRAIVGRDAQFTSLSVVLGSKVTKSWVDSHLRGQGSSVKMVGIMFADGKQRFHHHTLQDHEAPNTSSDLLFKAALADQSRSEYSGLIRVEKGAQKTDAYQANRNLALSEHARADSMPKLEIQNNDVRCTHGATVGPIDEEQLFYLQARGLSRASAERMIVQGFFAPIIEGIPLETVRQRVSDAVDRKLAS